ncbi:MAG: heme-binding domain-containing protein [Saprospiraceae bacterium]|nr:heme-binding domain-containing protein [Saprospiraceae bacterium]
MKTRWWFALPALVLLAAQAFSIDQKLPATRENEEFHVLYDPPGSIMRTLKHACFDCHSNHTRYPWYARVQPVGWWLKSHIDTGRQALNFSEFGRWMPGDQADVLRHCAKLVHNKEMPLRSYLWLHREARLTPAQQEKLGEWLLRLADSLENAGSTGARLVSKSASCDDDENPRCCFEGMPEQLSAVLTIAGDSEPGERLVLRGRLLQSDGKTPMANAILYAYHTNAEGLYAKTGKETGVQRWHGHLHGWLKTDAGGRYEIRTIRPAPYPGTQIPAHIHTALWAPEQGIEPQFMEEFQFDDDPLVAKTVREKARRDPARSGLFVLRRDASGVWQGEKNFRGK